MGVVSEVAALKIRSKLLVKLTEHLGITGVHYKLERDAFVEHSILFCDCKGVSRSKSSEHFKPKTCAPDRIKLTLIIKLFYLIESKDT